jgi:hypothetical protein
MTGIRTTQMQRPRLCAEPGVRLMDAPGSSHAGARSVHYSDGWTENYLGAVYREGRGAWSAWCAPFPATGLDRRVVPNEHGAWTFPTRDAAVQAILDAAEIHIPTVAAARSEATTGGAA